MIIHAYRYLIVRDDNYILPIHILSKAPNIAIPMRNTIVVRSYAWKCLEMDNIPMSPLWYHRWNAATGPDGPPPLLLLLPLGWPLKLCIQLNLILIIDYYY